MTPELHETVHEIVLEIVNASEIDDKRTEWAAYQKLVTICEDSEKDGRNHPFQWETLGDFTHDKVLAVKFYEKALAYAHAAEFHEYISSINLAMAEAFIDLGNIDKARHLAIQANESAEKIDDLELRKSISELLLQLSST
jgi:tetratricopeptide (TPR) repeat protein